MRYIAFDGITPKVKPQTAQTQVAHNLDLYSGELRPLMGVGVCATAVDVRGVPIKSAKTLYKAGSTFVGFADWTSVIPDTVGPYDTSRFLYVSDGVLYWQNETGVLRGDAPIVVGTNAPCSAPTGTLIVNAGCVDTTPNLPCDMGTGNCPPIPSTLTAYVYTYVKRYGDCAAWRYEESAPSPPLVIDVPYGDAVAMSGAALPSGCHAVRWYRQITGSKGAVYLFVGETVTANIMDDLCANELAEPLDTTALSPPPCGILGVASVGDAITLLWSERNIYVSAPHSPHAYALDATTLDVPYRIKFINSVTQDFEGALTYVAHVLTSGNVFVGTATAKHTVELREVQSLYPCISAESVCTIGGATGFSTYAGYFRFAGDNVVSLTDNYMTDVEWARHRPHDIRAAWHNSRLWMMYPDRDGFLFSLDKEGGARPKSLVTHSIRACAVYHAPDTGVHTTRNGTADVGLVGAGDPLWYKWRAREAVQVGLWFPTAVKVVSTMAKRRRNDDAAYAALNVYLNTHERGDIYNFVNDNRQYRHMLSQLEESPVLVVRLFRDGKLVYTRLIRDSAPIRVPRSIRATEWSIQVEGFTNVREVHMQTSIADLSQEGGYA